MKKMIINISFTKNQKLTNMILYVAELDNFVNSILKKEKPIVDGIAARNALDVVIKINEMILENLN